MEQYRQCEKTITIQEACYYGFFILLSLAKGLGFYEGQKLFYLLVLPALALGFLKICLSSYTKRQAVLQILLMALVAVVYFESRQIAIFFVAFTVLGMKGMSMKKVLHLAVWVWTICAIGISVFFFFPSGTYRLPCAREAGTWPYFPLESGIYASKHSAYYLSDAMCPHDI